jgi:predicted Zn-dependent protease
MWFKKLFGLCIWLLISCIGCGSTFTLNQSNYADNPVMYRTVHAESSFTAAERTALFQATQEWRDFTRGKIDISIVFDIEPGRENNWLGTDKVLVLKTDAENPNIVEADAKIHETEKDSYTLGLHMASGSYGYPTILLVMERIHDMQILRLTFEHELGHNLGLFHVDGLGIMYANTGITTCFTRNDAEEFCSHYHCRADDLKYCAAL